MKKNVLLAILVVACMFGVQVVRAEGSLKNATGNLDKVAGLAGVKEGSVDSVAGTVINTALTLVGLIFLVLMVYAGYLWMTAQGESEQIEKSKKIITAAIIGLVIVMSAYAITVLITGRFSSEGIVDCSAATEAGCVSVNECQWVETVTPATCRLGTTASSCLNQFNSCTSGGANCEAAYRRCLGL